jgi:hypothetical protein
MEVPMDNHILLGAKRKEAEDSVWRLEMMERIVVQCSMEDIDRLTEYLRFLRAEKIFNAACKAYIESRGKEHCIDCDGENIEEGTCLDCIDWPAEVSITYGNE